MTQEERVAELERKVESMADVIFALAAEVEAMKTPPLTLRDRINARHALAKEVRA